ncbi:MAG: sugar-binding protein [Opitutaceae bacterium]
MLRTTSSARILAGSLVLLFVCATTAFAQLSYSAKNTLAPITVDGNLNESVWSAELTGTVSETVSGTPNNTVTFGALWTSTHLYVAIKVLDSNLWNDTAGTNVWQDDSVEVYIDGNHNHATTYELTGGTNGLGNDRQFTKGYNDSTLAGTGSQTGVTHAWAAITGGYTIEIAIPWTNINVTGAVGLTIGFDIGNNDDDNGGTTREHQLVWAGTITNWNNTAAFGHLTLSATTVGDTTPPTVSITAPTGGTVSGSIAVSATASDNVGVVGVQFKLDGVSLGTEDTSSPYSITWDTTTATNASHTLTAVARDAAGNSTTSSGIAVTVSNGAAGTYSAKNTLSPINVDGSLSESVWSPELTGAVSETVSGTPNNTVTFGALWTSTHLYVAIKVIEPTTPAQLFNDTVNTGTPPTNVWQDDSVEVYIDGNNNGGTISTYELTGGASGSGYDRQFIKGYNDSALFNKGDAAGVMHAWAAITGGYTVEIRIPWTNINVTGVAGLTIGFDVGNNDDDNGNTTREHQLVWSGTVTNWNNTAAFGNLTLSATQVGSGAPEVNVTGAGLNIFAGDTTPQTADGSDFGSADTTSGTINKVFNIQNTGSTTLTPNTFTQSGDFDFLTTEPGAPLPTSIAAGGNANFTVTFNPTATGLRTATIGFSHNDATGSENPYTFAVQGTGTSVPTVGWSTKPFVVLEAEDGAYGGGAALLNATSLMYLAGTPQFEASGRKAVRLTSDSSYLRFTVPAGFNGGTDIVGLVVRHSIPDVFSGTASIGQDGLMSVWVNGALRQVIKKETGGTVTPNMTISSKFAWNYHTNNEVAAASYFKKAYCGIWFDDCRYIIQGAVNAGDTIELRATVSALTADSFNHLVATGYNGTKYCLVDLIELENVGAPVANPDTAQYLNVTNYGATPNDGINDAVAIKSALDAAVSQGKLGIYLPSGTFLLNTGNDGNPTLNANSVGISMPSGKKMLGAGIWHTMVRHNKLQGNGINVASNTTLQDFSFYGIQSSRSDQPGRVVNVRNYGLSNSLAGGVIKRIWLERQIGWIADSDGGMVMHCRVKNTPADGITSPNRTDNFTWQENYFRGTSDDCAAIWSNNVNPSAPIDSYNVCTNARWINNDMTCVRWGTGAGVWGSAGGAVLNNYIADTQRGGGVKFDSSQVSMGTSNFMVSGNKFVRCGNLVGYSYANQIRGAIAFVNSNSFIGGKNTGIIIENNEFIDPVSCSVWIYGTGQPGDFIFRNNTIANSTVPVLFTTSDAKGSAQFNNNTATNFTGSEYLDDNSPNFSFTKTGNIPNNWP